MENPKFYSENNELQRRDVSYVIDKYSHLIRWSPSGGDEILDIGTGNGDVLWEILRPALPKNYGKLVGCDISEKMLNYAVAHYVHPKIEFIQMDISSKIPDNFHEKFHHIFSFYCMQFVQDQRKLMQNLFNLLKPGGDMLLLYIGHALVFDIYLMQSKMPEFKPYMLDVQNYLAPYQHVQNAEQVLREILENVGFQVTLCENQKTVYEYENFDRFLNGMLAVNPFIKHMPDSVKAQYILQLRNELSTAFLDVNCDAKSDKFVTQYKKIIICASKPY